MNRPARLARSTKCLSSDDVRRRIWYCSKTFKGSSLKKGPLVRATSLSGQVVLGDVHGYVAELEHWRAPVTKVSGKGMDLLRIITRTVCL